MVDIFVYDKSGDDTSTTGLVGALVPISCEHEEIGNGMSSVTMVHPYDEGEKWKALQNGNILSVPVRVKTVPPMNSNGTYITSIEKWSVSPGLTKTQRKIYANEKKNKKKGMLDSSWEVYVLESGEDKDHNPRYKIKYPKPKKNYKSGGWYLATSTDGNVATVTDFFDLNSLWTEGWVIQDALDSKIEDVDISGGGIESACPSGDAVPQLFRIQNVEYDVDSKQITVYAVHISYDLSYMITVYKNDMLLNAKTAVNGIMDGIEQDHDDFSAFTDSGNERTSCDWVDMSVMNAFLDPENGFSKRFGTELVRDDYSLYFLANGGTNRGIRIEHGKNLTGAQMEINWEELVTVIKPRGVAKEGHPLYLVTGHGKTEDYTYDAGNYVTSPKAAIYGNYVKSIDCDDCTVEKGKKGVTVEVARTRMLKQAKSMLHMVPDEYPNSEKVDEPKITLTVNFQELGRTVEYERYKPLENVYLWDSVVVAAKAFGIEATAKVTRIQLDVLTNRVLEVELGDVDRSGKIYSWQLPSLTERNISAKMLNTETPVVQLSGNEFVATANQNGQCDEATAEYFISAWVGYEAVNPVIGTITGVPNGMTITTGTIITTGVLPLTLAVAANATLGNEEQCSGQISIPVTKPVETTLHIGWAKICKGENGEDGNVREFVYKLTDDTSSTPTIDQTTGHDSNDYIPSGWTDNPTGISLEHKYEWQSFRDKESGEWGAFSDPTIWSAWGEKGTDGDGTEYVYKLTDAATPVPTIDQTTGHNDANYIPTGWTNNPTGISETHKYEWVSARHKTDGVWGAFSNPALWAKYGETGATGPTGAQGPTGATGPQGQIGPAGPNRTTTYYQPTQPSSGATGDMWYDTGNDMAMYRYNGTSWARIKLDAESFAAGSIKTSHLSSGCITAGMINALEIEAERIRKPNGVTGLHFSDDDISAGYALMIDCVALLPVLHAMQDLGGTTTTLQSTSGYRWKELWLSGTVHANSDRALKQNIEKLNWTGLLEKLKPVRYRMKAEPDIQRFGFIAQDVRATLDEMGVGDASLVSGQDGDMDMAYTELIAPLVEGWQSHEKRINYLESENRRLRDRLDAIEAKFGLEDDLK